MKCMGRLLPERLFTLSIGLLAWPLIAPIQGATAATPDAVVKANPVRIRMASSDSISPPSLTKLINAMYDAPANPVLSNSRLGSGLARQRIVEALADGKLTSAEERFIISGSPFTDAETAALTKANATLMRAPVHAAHNAILASTIPTTYRIIDPLDPLGTEGGPPLVLDGPHPSVSASMMKMPWPALGSHFFEQFPGESWVNPAVLTLWGLTLNATDKRWYAGTDDLFFGAVNRDVPLFAARYEPSASNLYLLTALSKTAPDEWKKFAALKKVAGPSENFVGGSPFTIRARGVGNLLQYLVNPPDGKAGTMGPAPLWAVSQLRETYPDFSNTLWVSELQNGAKEWVAPTSDSVTKAIAAGGDTPLYALDHAVPGAYPLAWVDSIYLPATGLSIDEVNAVSAFIRFLATDGQDIVKADSDGVISGDLLTKALAAANAAVTSNCDAAKGVARLEADSPYYPLAAVAPKLHALPPQTVCATPVDPSTTTTTTITTTTVAATTTTQATTTTTTIAATTTTQATTTTLATTTRATTATMARATTTTTQPATVLAATELPTTTVPATIATTIPPTTPTLPDDQIVGAPLAPTVAALPLGLPPTGRAGFDRWTTMLLGGLVLRLARGIFRRFAA